MNPYTSIPVALLVSLLSLSAKDLIPFDDLFVSVETNDWMNRIKEKGRLNVSVRVSRDAAQPNGSISTDVDCYEFEADQRMLPKEDLNAFLAAGDAALAGEAYQKEVITTTFRGEVPTTYKLVDAGGMKMIQMSRGEKIVDFHSKEATNLKAALKEAQVGEAWFKMLLNADAMPEPNEDARPPRSKGYYLNSTIGTVSGKGIGYEVSVASNSLGNAPQYYVSHKLCLYSANGGLNGSLSGGWVAGLLQKIATALDSANTGKAYSFKSGEEQGRSYSVTANLETKEAEVILNPGKFFKGRGPERGSFGQAQLAEIRKLISDCDQRIKWFKENEHLFFTKIK